MRETRNFLLKNIFLSDNQEKTAALHCKNGVIEAVYKNELPKTPLWDEEKDGQGLLLLSGMIDVHTHMRDLGLSHKEDYLTGSKACLHGGITTFLDMPNTIPPTFTGDVLQERRKRATEYGLVNFGFHFGASAANNSEEIKKAVNIPSIKIFLNSTTGNLLVEDDQILDALFEAAPPLITLHAEGRETLQKCFNKAKKYNKNLYFCHIALEEEVQCIKEFKEEIKKEDYSFKVFGEATPHHLSFSQKDIKTEYQQKTLCMKPSLKTKKDKDAVMQGLLDGILDTIGTDHAPHLLSEKMEKETFGVPGVEYCLAFLLDLCSKKILSFEKIEHLYSSKPAEIFKMKGKGKIKEGYDADFVLVSPQEKTVLNKNNIVSKCGWSLYEDMPLQGKIKQTFRAGYLMYDDKNEYYNLNQKGQEVHFEQ